MLVGTPGKLNMDLFLAWTGLGVTKRKRHTMLLNVVVSVCPLLDWPTAVPVAALAGVLSCACSVQSLHVATH